jgi:hypothetical protein
LGGASNEQNQQDAKWGATKPVDRLLCGEVHSETDSNEFLT